MYNLTIHQYLILQNVKLSITAVKKDVFRIHILTGNPEKWESIFQSGKRGEILNMLKKLGILHKILGKGGKFFGDLNS